MSVEGQGVAHIRARVRASVIIKSIIYGEGLEPRLMSSRMLTLLPSGSGPTCRARCINKPYKSLQTT